jgi:ribose transport system substrate-binding protein
MKKNKIYLGLLISVVLGVIIYVSYGMLNIGREEQYYSISVIVDNSGSDRWNAFKEGLNKGMEDDSRIHINVVSTTEFSSVEEECMIIERELENGADGVIVEMCASNDEDGLFYQTVEQKPLILVDTDIEPVGVYTMVSPDQYELGKTIANAVKESEESEISGMDGITIGILSGNQNKFSMQQRMQGFMDVIKETDAEILWNIQKNMFETSEELESYICENPVDVIVGLENDETEKAADFLLENEDLHCRLYGEGRSEKAVYYLDKGLIKTLIVVNEYYMGYQCVMAMADKLEAYVLLQEENREIDFLPVTKESMYDQNIGEILFPVVR